MRNGGINETITVRRVFQGVGVERVFLIHSPRVESIKIVRRGKVRRAKLFYLRDRVGKATKLKERKTVIAESSANGDGAPGKKRSKKTAAAAE